MHGVLAIRVMIVFGFFLQDSRILHVEVGEDRRRNLETREARPCRNNVPASPRSLPGLNAVRPNS